MKKTYYDVYSPDGFSITRGDFFKSKKEAGEALDQWVKGYERQGHYSSNHGRIPLEQLALHCQLITVKA